MHRVQVGGGFAKCTTASEFDWGFAICEFQSSFAGLKFIATDTGLLYDGYWLSWGAVMKLENLADKSLIALYDSIGRQTATGNAAGLRSRVVGQTMRVYAEKLRVEMERRQLRFTPIDWHKPE